MNKVKNTFVVMIITTILILLINFIFIFFKKDFLSQNNLNRKLFALIPYNYAHYYPKINNGFDEYIGILGDSYAFGAGDSYLNNDYNYSIGHHLFNFYQKKINFVNFGGPGFGSKLTNENFFHIINSKIHNLAMPKKIIYFFYEGNDLQDNLNYSNLNKTNLTLIKKYFPVFHALNLLPYKIISKIKLSLGIHQSQKKNLTKNYYVYNNEKFEINSTIQGPPIELNETEFDKALNIVFENLLELKEVSDNISLIYIPSPAVVLKMVEPIKVQNHMKKKNNLKNITNLDLDKLNILLSTKIEHFCKKNNILFLNTTNDFKKISSQKKTYGPLDIKHPNSFGYKFLANLIIKNISLINENNVK